MNTVACRRHPDTPGPAVATPPFRSDLGERICREICARCWQDWLQHQTLLINHFGLDPRKREAREFLYAQVKAVLFGEGEPAAIDTSLQGTIGAGGTTDGQNRTAGGRGGTTEPGTDSAAS